MAKDSADAKTERILQVEPLMRRSVLYGYNPENKTWLPIVMKENWSTKSIAAGQKWICPEGQYEVYVLPSDNSGIFLHGGLVGYHSFSGWLPCTGFMAFTIYNIDPVTGDVTWSESDATSMTPQGIILSSGEELSSGAGAAFVVRFRRVG